MEVDLVKFGGRIIILNTNTVRYLTFGKEKTSIIIASTNKVLYNKRKVLAMR